MLDSSDDSDQEIEQDLSSSMHKLPDNNKRSPMPSIYYMLDIAHPDHSTPKSQKSVAEKVTLYGREEIANEMKRKCPFDVDTDAQTRKKQCKLLGVYVKTSNTTSACIVKNFTSNCLDILKMSIVRKLMLQN